MKYNFDEVNNRRNTNSLKWDVDNKELPMWVADMDFKTSPAVIQAIKRKAETGIFGYNVVPDEWYEAIESWWKRRHHMNINKEWLIFCTGIVPAITSIVKRVTNMGDNVLVQTPVYDIFFHSVENTGRHVLENKLVYDGKKYEIDFEALEKQLANPLTTMMILCNPHNPVGKIWTMDELVKIGELCAKHHVVVVSDEIHCDIMEPGFEYTPFASVSDKCRENSISCISATKAFNIAGLQTAAVMIPDEALREKIDRGLNSDELAEPNSFAIDSVIAAFNEGEDWLDKLNKYISNNKKYAEDFISNKLTGLKPVHSNTTYLLWVDCTELVEDTDELCEFLRKEHGIYFLTGGQYRGNGAGFIRINLACPMEIVKEGLNRLELGLNAFLQKDMVYRK